MSAKYLQVFFELTTMTLLCLLGWQSMQHSSNSLQQAKNSLEQTKQLYDIESRLMKLEKERYTSQMAEVAK